MIKKTSLVFTGDIGFDRYMNKKWEDPELLSPEIMDFFHAADHVVANVEGSLIDAPAGSDPSGKALFCHFMDPAAVSVLKAIRADVWNIANNHSMDMGAAGLESTMRLAAEAGSRTVGAGRNIEEAAKPLFIEDAGGIGIVSVGYIPASIPATETEPGNFPMTDMVRIEKAIKTVKERCRWCVVVSHGGEEFTNLPHPYIRSRYMKYLEFGADIVVAHHPHVPMNYETVGDKAIFYSLGNFIFDTDYQRARPHTDDGILLRVEFSEDGFTFVPFGIHINRETERIEKGEIPAIFSDVSPEDYELLLPLSAKTFIETEKLRRAFVKPAEFADFKPEDWEPFFEKNTSVPDEQMDFSQILPLYHAYESGDWKKSSRDDIKNYILEQLHKLGY